MHERLGNASATWRRVVETEEVTASTALVETFTSITWLIIAVNQRRLSSPFLPNRSYVHSPEYISTKKNKKNKKRSKGFNIQHLSKLESEIAKRFNREGNQPPQIYPRLYPLERGTGYNDRQLLNGGGGGESLESGNTDGHQQLRDVVVSPLDGYR